MNEHSAPPPGKDPALPETVFQGPRILSTCYSVCGVREVNEDVAACARFSAQSTVSTVLAAVADGRVHPPSPTIRPLAEAGAVLRDLLDRRLRGKAVLVP